VSGIATDGIGLKVYEKKSGQTVFKEQKTEKSGNTYYSVE